MKVVDFRKVEKRPLILVVEDVYETRAGIDTLLKLFLIALGSTAGRYVMHRIKSDGSRS